MRMWNAECRKWSVLLAVCAVAVVALAEDAVEEIEEVEEAVVTEDVVVAEEHGQWTYALIGSYVANRGNTHSDKYTATAEATFRNKFHRLYFGAGYAYARQKDTATGDVATSEDNWYAKGQYDHFITEALYAYLNAKHESDTIANLKGRETVGTGLGYQWIDWADFGVKTEGGVTYFHEVYDDGEGEREGRDVVSLRLAYGIHKEVNDTVQLFHNLEYLPDVTAWNHYLINADLGGRVKLTKHLLFEAKAEWRYNSSPLLDDVEKIDSRYTVGLGYTF